MIFGIIQIELEQLKVPLEISVGLFEVFAVVLNLGEPTLEDALVRLQIFDDQKIVVNLLLVKLMSPFHLGEVLLFALPFLRVERLHDLMIDFDILVPNLLQ